VAILTTFEIHGDVDELAAQHRDVIDPIAQPIAEENGNTSHTVVKTDKGIMIVNLWENEEGMEKTAAAVRPKAEEAGLPAPQNWCKYEVLRHRASTP
jgi:hypothetical protein